jgi:NAD(P)-dependent dehydrogenase (short-subunit alcohol dehydrogenase family)
LKRLEKKIAIVTGAARGMGRAISEAFVEEGATVVITDIDKLGEKTSLEINKRGGETIFFPMDVSKKADVEKVIKMVKDRFNRIDILVNNAGVVEKYWIKDMPEKIWDKVMDINAKGVFLCTQAVLPIMIEQKRGKIINIASIGGKIGEAANGVYSASKFAVLGFSQSLADEVGQYNIQVNSVCPGPIPTKLGEYGVKGDAKLRNISKESFRERYFKTTPLGRQGKCEEVAKAVLFFASDDCSFTTGCTLSVSGGMVKW